MEHIDQTFSAGVKMIVNLKKCYVLNSHILRVSGSNSSRKESIQLSLQEEKHFMSHKDVDVYCPPMWC